MTLSRTVCSIYMMIFSVSVSSDLFGQDVRTLESSQSREAVISGDGLPAEEWSWSASQLPDADELAAKGSETVMAVSETAEVPFTGIAIGWSASDESLAPGAFRVRIRSVAGGDEWPQWTETTGYIHPAESPSGKYWAMLYVTPDGEAHDRFEVELIVPAGHAVTAAEIRVSDARADGDGARKETAIRAGSEEMPDIIDRSGWWGDLPASQLEPSYSPSRIDITHAAVHHTVTANEPADPAQVVRNIWDWHVNSNGWSDIGYNFLVDHEGNVYQGRYNPWLEQTDVQGAHAGSANSRSTGIAMIGQFEPGASPQVGDPGSQALDALVKMISWRFTQNGIDPLGEEWIGTNFGNSQQLPTILGHRDVGSGGGGATACPGQNLYSLLPELREDVEVGERETEEEEEPEEIARGPFELHQNYPNPFRGGTTIPITMDAARDVRVELYTVAGDRVRTLFEGRLEAGEHEIDFNASNLPSGAYFYEVIAFDFRQMRQMVYFR